MHAQGLAFIFAYVLECERVTRILTFHNADFPEGSLTNYSEETELIEIDYMTMFV